MYHKYGNLRTFFSSKYGDTLCDFFRKKSLGFFWQAPFFEVTKWRIFATKQNTGPSLLINMNKVNITK